MPPYSRDRRPATGRREFLRLAAGLAAVLLVCGGACAAGKTADRPDFRPFCIVMLPDTQRYCEEFPGFFRDQTQWVVDNVAREKIAFVTHVGDVVQSRGQSPKEWAIGAKCLSLLDKVVPWGVAIGNHDYDSFATGKSPTFIKHFGPDRFRKFPWYGGASPNKLNSFQTFSAGGVKMLALHLEAGAPDGAIKWAGGVLTKHAKLPALVTTHIYLAPKKKRRPLTAWGNRPRDMNSGQAIWEKLIRKHPNVFMVLSGHFVGEFHQVSENDSGEKVIEVIVDFQGRPKGGNGWMRLIHFDPAKDEIRFTTYSPSFKRYEDDADSKFTFPLSILRKRLGK